MAKLEGAISIADPVRTYHSLDLFWARLAVHIRSEHLVVFPAVLSTSSRSNSTHRDLAGLLASLREDHDYFIKQLARAIKAMRLVPEFGNEAETFVVVKDLVDGVKQRLIEHNRIEEEIVYPIVGSSSNDPDEIAYKTLEQLKNLPMRFS